MKNWIPIPGSNKERLLRVALEEFKTKGYNEVNISELAQKADMTTGAIYHHFGSKAKLYEVIRKDIEQRVIDRMEGVISIFDQPLKGLEASLITALVFANKQGFCKLLSESVPDNTDRIRLFIIELCQDIPLPIEVILLPSWRSILKEMSEGKMTLEQGRELIKWLFERQ